MKTNFRTVISAAAIFISTSFSHGANAAIPEAEYARLSEVAKSSGYVNLLVSLDVDNSISALSTKKERSPQDYDAQVASILEKIDGHYLEKTLWKSRFGQFSVYVTTEGLRKIRDLPRIKSINETDAPGFINDPENQLKAIAEELKNTGLAQVEILPMKDPSVWSLDRSGQPNFKQENQQKSAKIKNDFLAELSPEGIVAKDEFVKRFAPDSEDPVIGVTINHRGFYELISRSDVRSIELKSNRISKKKQIGEWDDEALKIAEVEGSASIVIDLKRPVGYTPLLESLSEQARASQALSLISAFKEIIVAAEPNALSTLQTIDGFASATVTLSHDGLKRLYELADPRIQRVKYNRPFVKTSLTTSTSGFGGGTNAQYIRTFGARGAGQWLAILDTGVQRTHPVLSGKYYAEACFGTNGSGYITMCPQPNATGDSAYLLADSSIPCGVGGNFTALQKCSHGTKMAHIAGGRATNSSFGNVDGMAPDADFFLVNVFSKPQNGNLEGITAFDYDIASGLTFVNQLRNDFPGITVNMSVGAGNFSTNCPGTSAIVNDAISRLYQRNVAAIAATGNQSLRSGINFPACIANVIKVAGTSSSNGQHWPNSNFATPSAFTGRFFLAPAGVWTAIPQDSYGNEVGTSQAAAHISGAFAIIKSVAPNASILEIVNLLRTSHSVPTSVPLPIFGGSEDNSWPRLRFN